MAELTFESISNLLDEKLKEFPTKQEFNELKSDVKDIKDTVHELKLDNKAYAKDIVRLDKNVGQIQAHLNLKPIT